MIPFENTWPYEKIANDYYFLECPFCGDSNVLLPINAKQFAAMRDGTKQRIVLPCCHEKFEAVQADRDYFLANRRIRKMR